MQTYYDFDGAARKERQRSGCSFVHKWIVPDIIKCRTESYQKGLWLGCQEEWDLAFGFVDDEEKTDEETGRVSQKAQNQIASDGNEERASRCLMKKECGLEGGDARLVLNSHGLGIIFLVFYRGRHSIPFVKKIATTKQSIITTISHYLLHINTDNYGKYHNRPSP